MIGINIGSLNSSLSFGQKLQSALLFKTELLLSETSARMNPSVISFSSTHRVIGDQANLILRKNIKSSFQYLTRFIGFIPVSPFCSFELQNYHYVGGEFDSSKGKFSYLIDGEKLYLFPDEIVISYLHILYNQYILTRRINAECFVFAVPDYFTCFQKNAYLKIIQSAGIKKDFHLVNESSAITLYFGYKKYKEYFITQNTGTSASIDPTIIKYILFIDAGHSKTSLIFSKLTYNLFQVLDTVTLPFLGGRDFDDAIFKFCCDKFYQDNKVDLSKDSKIKLRLIPSIMKARKNLTVNKDAQIGVDSIYDDIDFSLLLTRGDFENIIKDKLTLFKNELYNFCQRNAKNYPQVNLTNVEMAGELMRTPSMESIVKEVLGMDMSKTILTDECVSVGCCLYGSLLKGCFPIKNFKGIYHLNHYSILYSINNGALQEFASDHHQIPDFKSLFLDEQYFTNGNKKINISFFHKKEEINNYLPSKTGLLISYDIFCEEILKINNGIPNLKITFLIDNIGEVHIKGFESQASKDNSIKINFSKSMIKISGREIYESSSEMNKLINMYTENEKKLFNKDQLFINFSADKNELEGKLYDIRNKIKNSPNINNNINNYVINGKNIMDCLQEIEDNINDSHNKMLDLKPLKNYLDNIIKTITPNNVIEFKQRLYDKINKFNIMIENENNNIKNGGRSRFNQGMINDGINMVEHFRKKLYLLLDMNEVISLNNEFDNETIKYSF